MLNALVTIIFTICSVINAFANAGAAAQDKNQPWELTSYFQRIERRVGIGKMLTLGLAPADRLNVEFDGVISEMLGEMESYSGFDAKAIATSWPDIHYYNRWLYTLFPGAFNGVRDFLMNKADECQANNDTIGMVIYRVLGVSAGMPKKVLLAGEEFPDQPGLYEIVVHCTYGDGSTSRTELQATWDSARGYIYQDGDRPDGILGSGFAMNLREGWAYNTLRAPQRELGYNKLYDDLLLKTTNMIDADVVRLKFSYHNEDWMLQLWKGRYFITTGGEIGMYKKSKDRIIEHYKGGKGEDLVPMSYRIRLLETGELLVDRPLTPHWWMTGFALRHMVYGPTRIALETEIVPLDADMQAGLVTALEREIAGGARVTYSLLPVDAETYGYDQAIQILW